MVLLQRGNPPTYEWHGEEAAEARRKNGHGTAKGEIIMNILVTVDEHWAIGNNDKLLVQIPRNQKLFMEETAGKVVVVGRKALQTFPQGMPLQGRTTIVLTKNRSLKIKGATVVHSLNELLKELKKYPDEDIYIAGGESVFAQMLPYCSVVHVTRIDHAYAANKYFPDLEQDPEWVMTADSDEQTYFDIAYEFLKYERKPGTGEKNDA